MKRFIEAADRNQATLFPECLEDWIGEDNPVRVIDAFVNQLDLVAIGFAGVNPKEPGRPSTAPAGVCLQTLRGDHPSALLKLYIYGYLNRVQSSRRLEREAGRNVEVMWLTGRLVPDHKTIADFRKDNGLGIQTTCAKFICLCRELGLLTKASVAIDGSKFKAVNNRDRNFTTGKIKRRMAQIDESVARYLHQLESNDRQEPSLATEMKTTRLTEKIAKLTEEMQRLEKIEARMLERDGQQVSFTDPDARSMATSGRGSGTVGYNVQIAVDTEHHLIVAHEVTNVGNDTSQLANMGKKTKEVLEVDELDAVADRGYFKSKEILACEQIGITVTLPKPQTSNNKAKGLFVKADFRFEPDKNVDICPAEQTLTHRSTSEEKGMIKYRFWTSLCGQCPIKARCTRGKERRVSRWEHEHVLEDVQRRLDENPTAMRRRRETVEHPFGTIKERMGYTHLLMKTLPKVATEMALHVLGYNLTRAINILGTGSLIKAMTA